jgi:CRP-like cAMP-binding protein
MLDGGHGTATITTTSPAKLMVMSHEQFRDVVKSHDGILVKVLAVMARRLRMDLDHAKAEARPR